MKGHALQKLMDVHGLQLELSTSKGDSKLFGVIKELFGEGKRITVRESKDDAYGSMLMSTGDNYNEILDKIAAPLKKGNVLKAINPGDNINTARTIALI